jgi:hypothetical protein
MFRAAALVVLFAGCDFVWRIDHLPPPDAAPPCSGDDFAGTRIAPHWQEFKNNDQFQIFQNDALFLDLALAGGTAAGEAGVRFVSTFDMTDGSVEVEVPDVVTPSPFVENYLRIRVKDDNDHTYVIRYSDGKLDFRTRVVTDTSHRTKTYDPLQDRFWRISNGPTRGQVTFSTRGTATDAWVDEATADAVVPFSSVEILLVAGMYGLVTNPGTAIYDNFNLCNARAL